MRNWVRYDDLDTSRIECAQHYPSLLGEFGYWRVTGYSGQVYWVAGSDRANRVLSSIRHRIFQSGLGRV